jgi:hypothetical protein
MIISISAVSKNSTESFIKLVASSIMVCLIEEPLGAKVKSKIRKWNSDAEEFLKRFRIPRSTFNPIVNGCLNDNADMDWDLDALIRVLKEREKAGMLTKELDLTKDHIDLLKYMMGIVLRGSDASLKNLTRHISKLGDPDLTAVFLHEDAEQSNQQDLVAELNKFCRKIFGKPEADLTVEDKNSLRDKKPEQYKVFLKLMRDINEGTKQATLSFVRQSGEKLVKATELVRYLKQNKIRSKVPEGFNGYVDENGAYYNTNKVKLDGAITGRLEANPKYDPELDNTYVFLHYPLFGTGQPQRIYTVEYRKEKAGKKFNTVDALIKDLPAARKKWLHELKTGHYEDADTVSALILELIYETSARIGTAGQSGQGISTLVCKNYTSRGTGYFTLNYLGKSGVKQIHKIHTNKPEGKMMKGLLDSLVEGKKPNDLIMTAQFGRAVKHVNGTYVNKYLRSLGVDQSITLHKFRHARGTIVAGAVLDKAPAFRGKSEAEINKWFIEAMKKVGEELGHVNGEKVTATTAIQNYIDPNLIKEWFEKVGARPNSTIQKAINKVAKD